MTNAIDASEDLAGQFEEVREFSSSPNPEFVLSDLRDLLNQAWGQLKIDETSKSTSFVVSSGTEHKLAEVDEFMITNAFRKILQNAMDSMPSGGTITVSFFETDETQRKSICLVFRDDGGGISEEEASLACFMFRDIIRKSTKKRGRDIIVWNVNPIPSIAQSCSHDNHAPMRCRGRRNSGGIQERRLEGHTPPKHQVRHAKT